MYTSSAHMKREHLMCAMLYRRRSNKKYHNITICFVRTDRSAIRQPSPHYKPAIKIFIGCYCFFFHSSFAVMICVRYILVYSTALFCPLNYRFWTSDKNSIMFSKTPPIYSPHELIPRMKCKFYEEVLKKKEEFILIVFGMANAPAIDKMDKSHNAR